MSSIYNYVCLFNHSVSIQQALLNTYYVSQFLMGTAKTRIERFCLFPHGAYREGGLSAVTLCKCLSNYQVGQKIHSGFSIASYRIPWMSLLADIMGISELGRRGKMIGLCLGNLQGVHRGSDPEAGSDPQAGSDTEAALKNPTRQRIRALEDMPGIVWRV